MDIMCDGDALIKCADEMLNVSQELSTCVSEMSYFDVDSIWSGEDADSIKDAMEKCTLILQSYQIVIESYSNILHQVPSIYSELDSEFAGKTISF